LNDGGLSGRRFGQIEEEDFIGGTARGQERGERNNDNHLGGSTPMQPGTHANSFSLEPGFRDGTLAH
jgi:hypothetical protein